MLKHAAATEGGTYTPETGARTWIWSDLHLYHKNIIRYCSRPFQSVEAMNEALLAAWKETVGEDDTIICGGDIALAGALKRERLARGGPCRDGNSWYAGTTTSEGPADTGFSTYCSATRNCAA